MASEFDLIRRYFSRPAPNTLLAGGDDCALVVPTAGKTLAVSTDLLVSGTHFFADTEPWALGWKTLAVNVSDCAAMGATPRWATLGLALPAVDEGWLAAFADGFYACADAFGVALIGGDTTRGQLTLSVTIFGEVDANSTLKRSSAQEDDDIWVSGQPGLAALGLAHLQGRCTLLDPIRSNCLNALHQPQPRLALGLALAEQKLTHSAIDISDGLLADLGHILRASGLAARLQLSQMPQEALHAADCALSLPALLAGGDDYELLFTAAPPQRAAIAALGQQLALPLSRIGTTYSGSPGEIDVFDEGGQRIHLGKRGYDHFQP